MRKKTFGEKRGFGEKKAFGEKRVLIIDRIPVKKQVLSLLQACFLEFYPAQRPGLFHKP